jgi:hypothetical protein
MRSRIIALKKSTLYEGANFMRFREPLEEREFIAISYTAPTKILKNTGIVFKYSHRGGDGSLPVGSGAAGSRLY